jgi:RimJ/RimL family protein N-acetyltransferase
MEAPLLTTERLTLRATRAGDFETYAAMWVDPRVTDFIGGAPRPRNEAWLRFATGAGLWPLLGYGYWIIADRQTDALVGVGGLAVFERGIEALNGYPEAGWAFAADHWGKGYATEAVGAMLAWADDALKCEIRCIIDPGNKASVRVADKRGFAKFGELRTEVWNTDLYRRPYST